MSMPSIVRCVHKRAFRALLLTGGTLVAQLLFAVDVSTLAPDVPHVVPNIAHPDQCSTKLPHSIEAERETTVRFL